MNDLPQPPQPIPGRLPVAASGLSLPALYSEAISVPEEPRESALRHYWRIFYKRRFLIAAITASCLVLALLVSMLTQRQYAARVSLEVARETAKVLTNIEGAEQDSGSAALSDEFYQTQYALLKSRSLSEEVVRDLKLADNYLFLGDFSTAAAEEFKSMPREARMALATTKVNANTIVEPVRMSSIINVRYNSPNPVMAATIANSIAENFVQSNLTRRFEAAAYARQFLQNRLNQVRAKLEESERKAVQYAQSEGIIKLKSGDGKDAPEQSLIANQLSELSGQLSVARAARAQAEAQYRAGTSGSIAAQQLVNPAVNALRQQRAELQGQLSKLQSDFGPEYPQVVALRSQISELDRQIGIEQGRVSSGVSQDMGGKYRQALATENALQSRVDALKSQLLGEEGRSIQYNIIQRDVDTNRALYEALLQRFKEVGVAGGIGTNNISIIDRALAPSAPFKPNLRVNILIGLAIGLLLGGLAAFVLEQLEEAAILPADFQRKFGMPLLGATPKLTDTSRVQEALIEPKSSLSEAYFSILTSVQFSTTHGTPSSFMLTSAQAAEGKSTTALALAQALTGVGAKVLLIDADMRNPSLHKTLGRSLGNGLSNLLTGGGKLDQVIQQSTTPNLWVMMSGHIPPNPAELLSTDAIDRVIAEASERFDHVVVDAPPILGLADAPLLTRAVEATIIVIEADRTRANQARYAIDRLLAVRANVIGAILSKFDVRKSGYSYGYGYGTDHAYSYGE